ncbi:MAG: YedE-related selenium metabolism membrane protein [Desulfuromonadales bacterium]|nr:YedE-related selenium metabolism membrane protein [Desulfuromonadales bacterium]
MRRFLTDRHIWLVIVSGGILGTFGVLLAFWGNPEHSGICISCFLENTAGALGLHPDTRMQYLRPELPGFILGAMASALVGKEFKTRGGKAPIFRFMSGFFLLVGCTVFIGCPIKLFLRLTAGDMTVWSGLLGLLVGIGIATRGLTSGVYIDRGETQRGGGGVLVPLLFLFFLLLLFVRPAFILFSERGSAAQHAPVLISLLVALLIGVLAQRSRFCITGALRDLFLIGFRAPLFWGLVAMVLAAVVTSLLTGSFRLGLYGQPGAHFDMFWSFAGMLLVGWMSVLIGGCPFRQLVKAGEGDTDAGMVVLGMLTGAGIVQSWNISATAAGVSFYGQVAVLVGLIFVLTTSLLFRERATA